MQILFQDTHTFSAEFLNDDQDLLEDGITTSRLNLAQELDRDRDFLASLAARHANVNRSPNSENNKSSPGSFPARSSSGAGTAESSQANLTSGTPLKESNSPHSLKSLPPQEGDWELWEVPVNVSRGYVCIELLSHLV